MFSDISSTSYQAFTFSFMSERPAKSSALNTSCSVNPKQSAYSYDVVVITEILLRSENILSLLILVMPVITALYMYGLYC